MALVAAKCTQCGAAIKVDESRDAGICEYCGTPFVTEKVINNYNNTYNIDNAVINIQGADIDNLLKRAQQFEKNNDSDRAIEYYDKVLDIDAENSVAKDAIKRLTQFYIGPFKIPREDILKMQPYFDDLLKATDEDRVIRMKAEYEIKKIIAENIKPIYFDVKKDFIAKYLKIGVPNDPFSLLVDRDSVAPELYDKVIEYEYNLVNEIKKECSRGSLRLPLGFEGHFYYNFTDGGNNGDTKSRMKIIGAANSYGNLSKLEIPLFVFDYTLSGSSDEGFLVTTKGIHIKNSGEDKIFFRFDEINRVEYKGLIFKDFYINDVKIGKVGVESSDIKSAIRAIEEYKRTFIKFPSPV